MIWIIAGGVATLLALLAFLMMSSPKTAARYLIIAVRPFFIILTCLSVLFGFWAAALPLYLITIAVIWFAPLPETREDRARRARYRSHRTHQNYRERQSFRERQRSYRSYQSHRSRAAAPPSNSRMTPQEARRILQIAPTASRQDINAAYKRLMREKHPDKGGSNQEAARINEARDILFRQASG